MENLNWSDVRTFLAVARSGTLAGAGKQLGVNASTVQRRIYALEQALDARLFERRQRGYALTQVGEALVPEAETMEAAASGLRRTASGHDRTARGPVTLTLPETLLGLLAPRLSAICAACPGLRPIIQADDRILDLGREADLALRPENDPPPDAIGRRVGRIAWAVYGQTPDAPWVLYATGGGPRSMRQWQRRTDPAPVLAEVSSVGAMHRVLAHTPSRGLLPCYLGDATPQLQRLGDPIDALTTDLWLLIHADLRRSARVRALIDLLMPCLHAMSDVLAGLDPG